MVRPRNPLYLTALTVIAYIMFRLWLVIGVLMSNNTSQSLLDSLLFIAEQNWGIDSKEIQEAMNKIDSIERERVARDNANIQRVDSQIKR